MDDWLVGDDGVGERIDSYLARRLDQTSRQKIQKLVRAGQILVNGQTVQVKYLVWTLYSRSMGWSALLRVDTIR